MTFGKCFWGKQKHSVKRHLLMKIIYSTSKKFDRWLNIYIIIYIISCTKTLLKYVKLIILFILGTYFLLTESLINDGSRNNTINFKFMVFIFITKYYILVQQAIHLNLFPYFSQDLGHFLYDVQHGSYLGCLIEHPDWSDKLSIRRSVNQCNYSIRHRSLYSVG